MTNLLNQIATIKWTKNIDLFPQWLSNKNSTTKLFNRLYPNRLNNVIINLGTRKINENEAILLELHSDTEVYVREVEMYIDNILVITARTILPTIYEVYSNVKNLGNTPIGTILFNDNFTRSNFEFAQFPNNNVVARRSIFSKDNQKLLLIELFSCDPNKVRIVEKNS